MSKFRFGFGCAGAAGLICGLYYINRNKYNSISERHNAKHYMNLNSPNTSKKYYKNGRLESILFPGTTLHYTDKWPNFNFVRQLYYKVFGIGETYISFYPSGNPKLIIQIDDINLLHSYGDPASIIFDDNGKEIEMLWAIKGKEHRKNGPSRIQSLCDNVTKVEYRQNNQFYRKGYLNINECIEYYIDGNKIDNNKIDNMISPVCNLHLFEENQDANSIPAYRSVKKWAQKL